MKQLFIVFVFFSSLNLFSQEAKENNKELQISIGYGIHSNSLNENPYLTEKSNSYSEIGNLGSISLKFTLPTKREYLDVFFGVLFDNDLATGSYVHYMNGGGVFAGLSPKLKGKHLGLTSEIGVGVFTFKEVYSEYHRNANGTITDIHEEKTTYGLGAMGSVGFYLKFGWIGINPNVNMLFTGGDDASFLFYGVSLPLTIYL